MNENWCLDDEGKLIYRVQHGVKEIKHQFVFNNHSKSLIFKRFLIFYAMINFTGFNSIHKILKI